MKYYNAVSGVPSCANDLTQNKIVREQWGFDGFFVSEISHYFILCSKCSVLILLGERLWSH